MTDKKESRSSAATLEQAMAGNVLADGYSRDYCTSNFVSSQILISDYLSAGQENAVPLRHLKNITGIDGRTVRRMIFEERLAGIPILADNQTGYYLPATQEEKQRCVRSRKHRAREIERVAEAIEVAEVQQGIWPARCLIDASAGQERIPGWFDG